MASSVAANSLAATASDRKSLRVPIVIATLLALGIASYFWIDSRYPALLKKLHSGAAIKTSGVLSFDAKMPVAPTMPLATRIALVTRVARITRVAGIARVAGEIARLVPIVGGGLAAAFVSQRLRTTTAHGRTARLAPWRARRRPQFPPP